MPSAPTLWTLTKGGRGYCHFSCNILQFCHYIIARIVDPKTFQKILVRSCCVTSFLCRCSANLTFLALQCPIFNQMSIHGSQTSQIKPNWNKRPLTRFKGFLENVSLKLLWRHLPLVSRLIWHSFFYNGHFSLRLVPMEAKLFKLHQTETKNLQLDPKPFSKILVWSCVT